MSQNPEPLYLKIATGHFNRQPVEWRVDQLIDRIKKSGEGVVSVAYLDIDRFSKIETEHSYGAADALLAQIEKNLKEVAKDAHTARYVRDSFLIVYEDQSLDDSFLATEFLRRSLSGKTYTVNFAEEDHEIYVTFSAGVASFPGDPEDRHELISLAEQASREAIALGGDKTNLGRADNMIPKTSHYFPGQLSRLRELREKLGRSDASLLREAVDDLLRKYDQRDSRRGLPLDWEHLRSG